MKQQAVNLRIQYPRPKSRVNVGSVTVRHLIFCCLLWAILFNVSCQKEQEEAPPSSPAAQGTGNCVDKATVANHLQDLSYAFLEACNSLKRQNTKTDDAATRETVNKVIVRNAIRGLHGYYYITIGKLLNQCMEEGLDMGALINAALVNNGGTNTQGMTLEQILADNNLNGISLTYHIVVPYLDLLLGKQEGEDGAVENVTTSDFEALGSQVPLTAYDIWDGHYPILGYKLEANGQIMGINIEKAQAMSTYSAFVNAFPMYECLLDGEYCGAVINNCAAISTCYDCLPESPVGTLVDVEAYSMMNHEIEIGLAPWSYVEDNYPEISGDNMDCYETISFYTGGGEPVDFSYYALLEAMPNYFNYYVRGEIGQIGTIRKLENAIADRQNPMGGTVEGNILKLCDEVSRFNSWEEPPGARFGLGHGGVYKLSRLGLPPLYFAFPYGAKIWFLQGPDMRIRFLYQKNDNTQCSGSGGIFDVAPVYNLGHDSFTPVASTTLLLNRDYLVTTDFDFIKNYWREKAIDIAFGTTNNMQSYRPENIITVSVNTPQNSTAHPNIGPLVLTLSRLESGSGEQYYEVKKPFETPLPIGTTIIAHVYATYEGGSVINHYFTHTVSALEGGSLELSQVSTVLRGKILAYQIDIYSVQ